MKKQVLQKHQAAAMNNTLIKMEYHLTMRIRFIENFAEVYMFPAVIARNNLRQYKKQLKAVKELQNFKP